MAEGNRENSQENAQGMSIEKIIQDNLPDILAIVASNKEEWMTDREAKVRSLDVFKTELGVTEDEARLIWDIYHKEYHGDS